MGGVARRVGRERPPALGERELLELEVAVDPGEARAARGEVRIEQEPRAVDRAVVVQLDRAIEVPQGLDRPVRGLLRDRPVEPGRRVEGIEVPRGRVLALVEAGALLLEVGLAEVAAHERVVRREVRGDLDVARAAIELAAADAGETQAESGEGIGGVERDGPLELPLGGGRVHLGEPGVPEDGPGPRELRRERRRPLRRLERRAHLAEGGMQLGEACPGERVLRVERDGALYARPRAHEIEARLERVREREVRGGRGRRRLDGGPGEPERAVAVVLDDGDDRLERKGPGVVGRGRERPLEIGGGLVHAADGEQELRTIGEQADVRGRRDLGDRGERASEVSEPVGGERQPELLLHPRLAHEVGRAHVQYRRIVERPPDGVARPRHDPQRGRLAALRDGRLPPGEGEGALRVRRQHRALEHGDRGGIGLRRDDELRAADAHGDELRVHVEAARASREEVDRAAEEVDHAGALRPGRAQLDGRALPEPQDRSVEQGHHRAAPRADADRVVGGECLVELHRCPVGSASALRLHGPLDGDRARDPIRLERTRLRWGEHGREEACCQENPNPRVWTHARGTSCHTTGPFRMSERPRNRETPGDLWDLPGSTPYPPAAKPRAPRAERRPTQ